LVQEKDDPFSVATRVMRNALYGPHNPYGYPDIGTPDSLKTISRENLVKFWQEHYFPNDSAIIVAGNIKLATLKPLLEKAFGAWKPGQATAGNRSTGQLGCACYSCGPSRRSPNGARML